MVSPDAGCGGMIAARRLARKRLDQPGDRRVERLRGAGRDAGHQNAG
jgi:hypothetical protein